MSSDRSLPSLASLNYISYVDGQGNLPQKFSKSIGVYAIFDQDKVLQFVHYSRDIYLSLKQHLVRQPQHCYWVKVEIIERPNRTELEQIKNAWIEESGCIPLGNSERFAQWTEPIDAKLSMTNEDKATYEASDELGQIKFLKKIAGRVEAELMQKLEPRNIQETIRFNPKLKEKGLLDLK